MSKRLSPQALQDTAEAVLRTLLYSDVFDFPLRAEEIHYYLIEHVATSEQVAHVLEQSGWLSEHIERANGYYAIQGRADNAALREERKAAAQHLWPIARRYGRIIGRVPFVRMVAVTGALAANNPLFDDDIDFIIVTRPGRVWTTRLVVIGLVKIARLFNVGLCPNYVLSEDALLQTRRDLFTARELAQMIPIAGFEVYAHMRAVNAWADVYLPNARGLMHYERDRMPGPVWRMTRRLSEWVLGIRLVDWLEAWERKRKIAKFGQQVALDESDAILDEQHVKGHFADHGLPIMDAYHRHLVAYGMAPPEQNGNGAAQSVSVREA